MMHYARALWAFITEPWRACGLGLDIPRPGHFVRVFREELAESRRGELVRKCGPLCYADLALIRRENA